MDAVNVGYAFSGFRNDGRYFVGIVESVKPTAKGTLVVIHADGSTFKSFYLETMDTYSCGETRHWPAGLTHAEYVSRLTSESMGV